MRACAVVLSLLLAACAADRAGLGGLDGSATDLGTRDGAADARDAGGGDATDLGVPDAADTGTPDDLGLDLGSDLGPDLGTDVDLGLPDLGTDLGPPDLGGMDAGPCGPCAAPLLCCGTTCVDPRSDPLHCGGCAACGGGAHATATCMSSTCGLACATGFDDCDGVAGNGCEADLATPATCGSCMLGCAAGPHQTASCPGGTCSAACDPGFADCDLGTFGCETDITSSATHCGACGTVCATGRSCASSTCSTGWLPLSAVGSPSARTDHTAVWTGTRMLVWGGDGFTGSTNTGASYDPATDSWTAITTTGAPSARRGHTAVWTGTEMLIWGGYNGAFLQDGGAYNPATNTWRTLATTGRPSARSRVPGVWSGTEMVIWGGFGTGSGDRQDGARYDPAANTWAAITNAGRPGARRWQAAVWAATTMVVWGGETGGGAALGDGAQYGPSSDTWTTLVTPTAAPSVRARAAFVYASGIVPPRMLVWGGDDGDAGGIFGNGVRASGGRYDPAANAWAAMSASPLAGRSRATAVWTGSKMMVWGGRGANAPVTGFTTVLGDGASYDPVTDTWSAISATAAPTARTDHTAVWTGTEMIVFGGNDGITAQGSGGRYAP